MNGDRVIKMLLALNAVILAALLFRGSLGAESVANAQSNNSSNSNRRNNEYFDGTIQYDVKPLGGLNVFGLKEVEALGDGKTFIVAGPDKFMVYQVQAVGRIERR